jgi:hypothetical protein
MPTLIGTNTVTSISRTHILPEVTDVIYPTNAVFFRLNQANKKMITGGIHVEAPFMYQQFANGGPYQGYDLLDVAPNDTIKNGGWDIKQQYVPVTVDGLTLARCNTPEAVVNLLSLLWEQAAMQLANNLGTGLWSDIVTDPKQIDGLKGTVDQGSVATSYAGLTRSSNTWLNSILDSSTATLTLASLRTMMGNCTIGGHAPTIIVSRQEQYNRFWSLLVANQRFVTGPGSYDEQLGTAGFTNLLFDNVPWIIDSKCFNGANASNSAIVFLNEEVLRLAIFSDTDFYMEDFQKPVNQDAMVGKLLWYGNLLNLNPQLSGKMTAVTG